MEYLDGIRYELLDYSKYRERLKELLCDDKLLELGIDRKVIGKSTYGYDIDCITIGNGDKHLFIVGGTHGSEIIGVDFVTQLIGEVKNFKNFDPNEFKLFIIPLQNPEGFCVTTDTLNGSKLDSFQGSSYEYYYRYRLDNLIFHFVSDLDKFFEDNQFVSENTKFDLFKLFLNNNDYVKKLSSAVKGFDGFVYNVIKLKSGFNLRYSLAECCEEIVKNNRVVDRTLSIIMRELKEFFLTDCHSFTKFHQDMFNNVRFSYINNKFLGENVEQMYQLYRHPLGSLVTFDSTGLGINLNANSRNNPGIEYMKNGKVKMALAARNNVRNYVPGPLGVPTMDPEHFEYASENVLLYNLIKESYDSRNYIGTLLYHSTGGSIYYEPCEYLVNKYSTGYNYQDIFNYNINIANVYSNATGYKLNNWSSYTGYGDYLRAEFPGVLMIELSKMGGNPIAPYGDKGNIYNTLKDNYKALDKLLEYFNKLYKTDVGFKKHQK